MLNNKRCFDYIIVIRFKKSSVMINTLLLVQHSLEIVILIFNLIIKMSTYNLLKGDVFDKFIFYKILL